MPHLASALSTRLPGPRRTFFRRSLITVVFLLLTGTGILLFADFLWRGGLYGLKYVLLGLFCILFAYLSFGFTTSLFGFISRSRRSSRFHSIDRYRLPVPKKLPRTALLFPVYNEDPARVFAGLRATFQSLAESGRGNDFDFYILSDSTNLDRWIQEEVAWFQTCRDLKAFGRIFYRHRAQNTAKKAGNISDFLAQWGSLYLYMVIFDADSLMTGDCLLQLVAMMEANPQTGIIQTVPKVVEAETLYARAQQFASSLYGTVFAAGLNFWQNGEGNYWGHNAIIRVEAFIRHCELPILPWREPLGGRILSHDFVEAALMRRAGYKVWLAHNIEGSYEEGPPNGIEAAQRDRRWCQGNLQHLWLVFARRFNWVSRIHFLNGILSYASGFIWFWFLVISTLALVQFENSGLTLVTVPGFMGYFDLGMIAHGLLLFGFTAILLFTPKLFSLIDLARERRLSPQFGGLGRAAVGVFGETLFSALQAPLNMMWHTLFIVSIPFGQGSGWGTQNRSSGGGVTLAGAVQAFWKMSTIAILWGALVWVNSPVVFYWMAPVLLPIACAIPIALFSSSPGIGRRLRASGLWVTPAEFKRPAILLFMDKEWQQMREILSSDPGFSQTSAVTDPMVHTLHLQIELNALAHHLPADASLAESLDQIPEGLQGLIQRWAGEGPASLSRDEMKQLLSSPAGLIKAHQMHWTG